MAATEYKIVVHPRRKKIHRKRFTSRKAAERTARELVNAGFERACVLHTSKGFWNLGKCFNRKA